jgi:ParB/RepB/Spo0J family partition protein
MKKEKPKKSANHSNKPGERRKRKLNAGSHRTPVGQVPAPTNQATSPSYKVRDIAITKIKVVGERRAVNPTKVKRLVESMRTIGLRVPLTVRPLNSGPELVTGRNRLAAAKILKWKTVPCMDIRGGKVVAEMWQIAENLHRAGLSPIEESEQIARWVELRNSLNRTSDQRAQKKGPGRPEGGKAAAARELSVPGETEGARRKNIERGLKIDGLDPDVKAAATKAGFNKKGSKAKLHAIAAEKTKEAQLAKVRELAARVSNRGATAGSTDDGKTPFEVMEREFNKAKKLRLAWKGAPKADRDAFITKVLKYVRKDED